jgi:hypothetical protein
MDAASICGLVQKNYEVFKKQAEIITSAGVGYLPKVLSALSSAASFGGPAIFDQAKDLISGLPTIGDLENALKTDLELDPNLDDIFYNCPFLQDLFNSIPSININLSPKFDIFGNAQFIDFDTIMRKYQELVDKGRDLIHSVVDPLVEKAINLLLKYEMFLQNSGIYDLLDLIDKIYACFENLCQIVIQPEENLINKVKGNLKIGNNDLDLVQIAQEASIEPSSLVGVYNEYKLKVVPEIPETGSKLSNFKKQFTSQLSF